MSFNKSTNVKKYFSGSANIVTAWAVIPCQGFVPSVIEVICNGHCYVFNKTFSTSNNYQLGVAYAPGCNVTTIDWQIQTAEAGTPAFTYKAWE